MDPRKSLFSTATKKEFETEAFLLWAEDLLAHFAVFDSLGNSLLNHLVMNYSTKSSKILEMSLAKFSGLMNICNKEGDYPLDLLTCGTVASNDILEHLLNEGAFEAGKPERVTIDFLDISLLTPQIIEISLKKFSTDSFFHQRWQRL